MCALLDVQLQLRSNDASRLFERSKQLLQSILPFETADEPFDDPILFRRIGSNELLRQTIMPTGLPKPATLEGEAVIAS